MQSIVKKHFLIHFDVFLTEIFLCKFKIQLNDQKQSTIDFVKNVFTSFKRGNNFSELLFLEQLKHDSHKQFQSLKKLFCQVLKHFYLINFLLLEQQQPPLSAHLPKRPKQFCNRWILIFWFDNNFVFHLPPPCHFKV